MGCRLELRTVICIRDDGVASPCVERDRLRTGNVFNDAPSVVGPRKMRRRRRRRRRRGRIRRKKNTEHVAEFVCVFRFVRFARVQVRPRNDDPGLNVTESLHRPNGVKFPRRINNLTEFFLRGGEVKQRLKVRLQPNRCVDNTHTHSQKKWTEME